MSLSRPLTITAAFIFALCILQLSVNALHLTCRDNEVYQYHYEAEVNFFQTVDEQGRNKSQNIFTEATIQTHCVKKLDGDPETEDDDALLLWVKFFDIRRYAKIEDADTGLVEIKELNVTSEFTPALLQGQLLAQDIGGKIFKFVERKDEPVDYATMKKAVYQMLQTSTETLCEYRELNVGTVDLCYKKAYLVEKEQYYLSTTAKAKNIIKKPAVASVSAKHDKWDYSHEVIVDLQGRIRVSYEEVKYAKGKTDHPMVNPQVERDLQEGGDPALGDMANGDGASSLQLTHILLKGDANATVVFQEIDDDVAEVRNTLGTISHLIDFVEENDELSFGELAISTQHAVELKERYKAELEQGFDFWTKLQQFKLSGGVDTVAMSQLRNYIAVVGVDTHKLFDTCFGEIVKEPSASRKPTDFMNACQSLLMTDHSDDAQEYIVQTMKLHPRLMQHGFVQLLHLNKPIGGVTRFLVQLQKYDTFVQSVQFTLPTPESFNAFKDQAYLVLAGLLQSMPRRRARHLLKIFLKHLEEAKKSGDHTRVLFVTNALHNAGHAAPWHVLAENILDSDNHPEVQKASVMALSTHTSPKTHKEVSAVLGLLAFNHELEANLRASAVLSQLQREQRMDEEHHGALTQAYKILYNNPHLSPEIHSAIEQYLHHDASDEAASVLSEAKVARENFDAEKYLQDVMEANSQLQLFDGLKKAFQAVGDAIKKVADVITAPFTQLQDKINDFKDKFLGAVREPEEKCFYMTKHMHKMCVRDSGMADFVQFMQKKGQVESKAVSGEQLVYEKYFGVNALNLYAGFAGGTFSAIECGSATVQVGFTEFVRANIRLNYLDKHLDLMTAYAYVIMTPPKNRYKVQTGVKYLDPSVTFDDTTPQEQFIHDKIYFRVINWVLVDQGLLPNSFKKMLTGCERNFNPVIEKYWNPIFTFDLELSVAGISIGLSGGLEARLTVVIATNMCPTKLHASVGLEPTLNIAGYLKGQACAFGACISARLDLESQLQLTPKIGLFGCKFCAVLESDTYPLRAVASFSYSLLGMGGTVTLMDKTWGRLPGRLIELCHNLKFAHERWEDDTLSPEAFAKSMTRLTA
mmetsp:Transcript_2226/g.8189  ORF Transcript_2226/g.8189 Transcript_2226/m.8189 type:complete len:1090 (-) Transcript_2226:4644-7913(-)